MRAATKIIMVLALISGTTAFEVARHSRRADAANGCLDCDSRRCCAPRASGFETCSGMYDSTTGQCLYCFVEQDCEFLCC